MPTRPPAPCRGLTTANGSSTPRSTSSPSTAANTGTPSSPARGGRAPADALTAALCLTRLLSELRLVRVLRSEGGIYEVSASHEDAAVHHTFHVYVISKWPWQLLHSLSGNTLSMIHFYQSAHLFPPPGKPVIIGQDGPIDGQVRCIAAGYPVPRISWFFCELPHTRYT